MPDVVSDQTREKRNHRESLKSNARRMRREPTPAEIKFWYQVRDRRLDGLKFKRQVPIGPFIADFVCLEHKLIVEIDGGQHADETGNDERREAYLKSAGFSLSVPVPSRSLRVSLAVAAGKSAPQHTGQPLVHRSSGTPRSTA